MKHLQIIKLNLVFYYLIKKIIYLFGERDDLITVMDRHTSQTIVSHPIIDKYICFYLVASSALEEDHLATTTPVSTSSYH